MDSHNAKWHVALFCIGISGCTPHLGYHALAERDESTGTLVPTPTSPNEASELKTTSAANPADGEFIYGFGRSSILLPAPVKEKGGEDVLECDTAPASKVGNTAWANCLANTTPKVVAAVSPDYVYAIRPSNGLYVKAIANSEPVLTQSITFAYQNPVTKEITDTGPVIAAAYTVGGAPLAGAAVLFIEASKHFGNQEFSEITWTFNPTQQEKDAMKAKETKAANAKREFAQQDAICSPTRKRLMNPDSQAFPLAPRIYLPVSLRDNTTQQAPAKKIGGHLERCWEMFPQNDLANSNRGWFYRIVDAKRSPSPIAFPPTFYANDEIRPPFVARRQLTLMSQVYFAVPACRAVTLQLTWWENLYDQKYAPDKESLKQYPVAIADAEVMQMLNLSKSERTISLLSCGGYATAATGAGVGDTTGAALIKQVKDIHASEQAFEKER